MKKRNNKKKKSSIKSSNNYLFLYNLNFVKFYFNVSIIIKFLFAMLIKI